MPNRYLLLGANVGRSPTPKMMGAAFRALGLDADFESFSIEQADFDPAFSAIKASGVSGLNVTMPYKLTVVRLLDLLEGVASKTRAVNTVKHEAGKYVGYNTDVQGIVRPLAARGMTAVSTAAVFGTGGAARAFAAAMSQLGCRRLDAISRRPESASDFASEMSESFPPMEVERVPLDALPPIAPEILFNATPCGSNGIPVPRQLNRLFESAPMVFDAVYAPVETDLIKAARDAGCAVVYGHEMLLHQGAEAFSVWTGSGAPLGAMREALSASLELIA